MNYNYFMPVRIIYGKDCIKNNTDVFKKLGKRAFIATSKSLYKNNYLKDLLDILNSLNVEYQIYDKCLPNPTTKQVQEMGNIAKSYDYCIAFGGGSTIDAVKACAVMGRNDITVAQLYNQEFDEVMPIVAIPTTAGTGSEVTSNAVLTTDVDGYLTKKSVFHEKMYPTYAFLDAAYTVNMPLELTRASALDALTHSIEGFLSTKATPIGEIFAKESIKIFADNYEALKNGELSLENRQELLLGSTYAGIVIALEKTTAPHAMSYALTTHNNISHGNATGLLIAAFVDRCYNNAKEKVETILSLLSLNNVDELYKYIDVLIDKDFTVSQQQLKEYAAQCWEVVNSKPNPVEFDEQSVFDLYKKSLI